MDTINSKDIDLLSRSQFLMLFLLASKNSTPIKGKLWLEKELFLLTESVPKLKELFDFEAYLLGPYSEIVKSDLEVLVQMDYIDTISNQISITKKGLNLISCLEGQISKKLLDEIYKSKDLLNDLKRNELLAYIYQVYPDTTKESIAFDKIKPKLREIAIVLLKKDKISIGLAAKIANMSYIEFFNLLKEKGMIELVK